jgi:hypothetical protein
MMSSSGCSLAMQEPLAPLYNPRTAQPYCTQGKGFVVGDAILGIGTAALAIGASQLDAGDDSGITEKAKLSLVVGLAGTAVVYATSAGLGYMWSNECLQAHRQHDAYIREFSDPAAAKGFYCTASTCVRERESCERRRKPFDDPPCELQRTAFCFDSALYRVCRPTLQSCERQLTKSSKGAKSDCRERD